MKKYLLYGVVGSTWFALVFLVTWWLSFPAEDAAQYARLQVQQQSRGAMSLELASLAPTLPLGVTASDVTLYSVDSKGEAPASPLLTAQSAVVRAGLLSVLKQTPALSGSATIYGGEATFSAETKDTEDGLALGALTLNASGLNVALMPAIPVAAGFELALTGGLDAKIDLEMADGFSSAGGTVELHGEGITVPQTSIIIANPGPFVFTESTLELDVKKGRARITEGRFTSDAVQVEVVGELELEDSLSRSTAQLKITLCMDMEDPELKKLEGYLRPGLWDSDECFHYSLSGPLARPRFRPERESRRVGRRNVSAPGDNAAGGAPPPPRGGPEFDRGEDGDKDEDEMRQRREERLAARRERLRERREARDRDMEEDPDMERRPGRLRPREMAQPQEESDTDEPPPPRPRGEPMRRDDRLPEDEFYPDEQEPPQDFREPEDFVDEESDAY